ncbi:MAG: radical SAM/SPASM domain-containing protein [Candidatus Woesearchaeota archaeon]
MVTECKPLSTPYSCYVNLTNKCNLRCLHCLGDYTVGCDNELSFNEWKDVIDQLVDSKVFYINISGGEPTQHPEFEKIINYLGYRGLHFILTTNGIMNDNIAKAIIKNGDYLIGIKISLDGYDPKSHCAIRKTASNDTNYNIFHKTMKSIKMFKDAKIPLTIATVMHSENMDHFDKFVDVICEIDPISWFISPIIPSGRGNNAKTLTKQYEYLDKQFWINIVDMCNAKKINVKLVDLPFDMKEKTGLDYYECGATITFCEINADGIVAPCTLCRTCIPEDKITFDNLRKKNLSEIWNGNTFNTIREYMTQGCSGCKAFSKCNKCIAQSFRYFGDGISPTPYCIRNGGNLGIERLEYYNQMLKDDI